MASKAIFLLCINLVFFTMVSSNYVPVTVPCPPPPSVEGKCPKDALKIQACANVLNGLVHAVVGPPRAECCTLLDGLVDLDAALCLCTNLKADLLGLHLNVPISLSLLLNFCGKAGVPSNFQCPNY